MTDFTVTDKKALRGEILQVRQQGYAITAQELRRGYHAVAVPLRRYDGATIAARLRAWRGLGVRSRRFLDGPSLRRRSYLAAPCASERDDGTLQPQLL